MPSPRGEGGDLGGNVGVVQEVQEEAVGGAVEADEVPAETFDLVDADRELVAAGGGAVRDDVGPEELGSFCMHALNAAGQARSKAAVPWVVDLTLAALRP